MYMCVCVCVYRNTSNQNLANSSIMFPARALLVEAHVQHYTHIHIRTCAYIYIYIYIICIQVRELSIPDERYCRLEERVEQLTRQSAQVYMLTCLLHERMRAFHVDALICVLFLRKYFICIYIYIHIYIYMHTYIHIDIHIDIHIHMCI